ncbi:MAG: T9SS type A sorting domain-containing protein [Bacteroidales bacterium]|nr:T9SS type A sorting domain-containing protein [Bacteroidales bacterium]
MKKFVLVLVVLLFSVQSYAQSCREIPFQPTFGVVGQADTANWLNFSSVRNIAAPSYWSFRPVNVADTINTALVPFLFTQTPIGVTQIVTLYSPCLSLDTNKTYELRFTFVGQTRGFMNGISVWLAAAADSYSNNANTFTVANDTFRLLGTFENLYFGVTELAVLINSEHFPPAARESGNYRIVFKSETASRSFAGVGNYAIVSYLKNIILKEASTERLEVVAMTSPQSSCNLSDQILSFNVRNNGYTIPATYNICFRFRTNEQTTFSREFCQPFSVPIPFDNIMELSLTDHPQSFDASLTLIEAWAEFSGQTSDTLRTNLHRTVVQTVPYSNSFDNPMFFQTWSIISDKTTQTDVTWHIPLNAHGAMSGRAVIFTSGETSNDRLESSCIELEAGTLYQISFTYSALVNPNFRSADITLATTENLSLFMGRRDVPNTPNVTLMNLQSFNNTDERTITTYFMPTETGAYFFGFLAYSEAFSAGISLSDFSIIVAPDLRTLPVFMSFESYDNHEGWQTFSHNTIDSITGSAPIMRGWQMSTANTDRAHGSPTGLRTFSSVAVTAMTTITLLEQNNNWLISPPIVMDSGRPVEIRYFRRSMVAGAEEILNIRVSESFEIQALSETEPLFSDTTRGVQSNQFAEQNVYFTPTRTGVHFVTFQYNSANRRGIGNQGMSLDEISIQDSVRAQEMNLSVIELRVPSPNCVLRNAATDDTEAFFLTIKNRTGQTIPANTLASFFRVTDPSGNTAVFRGTRVGSVSGTGNFPAIPPYGTATVHRRHDLRPTGAWEVQAWFAPGRWVGNDFQTPEEAGIGISDFDPSDDTSAIMRTAGTGTHVGRYDMGFEPYENIYYWRNNRTGNSRHWWQFINNPAVAHTGVGAAFVAPTRTFISAQDTNRQSIASPCLTLAGDTTYFISFFLRAAEDSNNLLALNPVTINTYIGGNQVPVSGNLRNTTSAGTNLSYKRHSFFFRPSATIQQAHVVLEAVSPRWSTGVYLDNFVIMDSVSATTPRLSLNRIWTVSSNSCNLSDDTLYVELTNSGFFEYQNPSFSIEFGEQILSETWEGIVPTDTTIIIRLNTKLSHTDFGKTEVTISLDIENNLAEQISSTASSIKTAPIRPPFTINFSTAEESEFLGWNNLSISLNNQLQPTFEYWTFGQEGATFQNGTQRALPGILASICFDLDTDEPYLITYEYRGASAAIAENLHVLREKADGTLETLFSNSNILTSTWTTNNVSFTAVGDQGERIRFLSNFNAFAQNVHIRSFSIKVDTMSWPADAELVRFIAPKTDTGLTDQVPITIEVANLNRRPLFNLPVFYSINGGELVMDSIPAVLPGDMVEFTFRQKADLSVVRDYNILIVVNAEGDVDRSNDTIRETISWPGANAKLVRLVSPTGSGAFETDEQIIVEVTNLSPRPLYNLHLYYSINGGELHVGIIPELRWRDTVEFTFEQRVDLSAVGDYEILVFVNAEGDIDRSNDTIRQTVVATSISNLHQTSLLEIHPNPATTEVFIRSENEISILFIHDMRGQLIREIWVNSMEYHLNTSDFPAGVYLFSTIIGNERTSQRVIINQP